MEDITASHTLEVQIRADGKVVWVNVDGICQLRACQISEVIITDDRPKPRPKYFSWGQ